MKQPGVLIILFVFVAAVSFGLAADQFKANVELKASLNSIATEAISGSPHGSGTLILRINAAKNQICHELKVSGTVSPTSAQLVSNMADGSEQVVLNLPPPTDGLATGCTVLDDGRVSEIVRAPENYYLTVGNPEFPDQVIRGQLHR